MPGTSCIFFRHTLQNFPLIVFSSVQQWATGFLPKNSLIDIDPKTPFYYLDNSCSNTDAWVGGQFQAFVMDQKITNWKMILLDILDFSSALNSIGLFHIVWRTFAVQSSVEKTPVEEVKTDVAVNRPRTVESLLGEGVAMVVNNRLLQIPHRPIRPTWDVKSFTNTNDDRDLV